MIPALHCPWRAGDRFDSGLCDQIPVLGSVIWMRHFSQPSCATRPQIRQTRSNASTPKRGTRAEARGYVLALIISSFLILPTTKGTQRKVMVTCAPGPQPFSAFLNRLFQGIACVPGPERRKRFPTPFALPIRCCLWDFCVFLEWLNGQVRDQRERKAEWDKRRCLASKTFVGSAARVIKEQIGQ